MVQKIKVNKKQYLSDLQIIYICGCFLGEQIIS